ncbi:Uncharacterised protein [Corynebacterium urealyticum]|nr:Uncharacterised protein [Corynebacterium urealyticum]
MVACGHTFLYLTPSARRAKQLPPIATRYHVLPVLLLTALHKPGREQLQTEGKWPDNDVHQQYAKHEIDN